MSNIAVKVISSGSFLPGKPITIEKVDHYLGELHNASPKVIKWQGRIKKLMEELLEVESYHYAIDPKTGRFTEDNITMSVKAANNALQKIGLPATEIDLICYGSAHQDQMPTASVRIQEQLGIEKCTEFSIHANCTSAYKAFTVAFDQIRLGKSKTALVVSSSMASSELHADYYNQELIQKEELFLRYFLSDGAGALILQATDFKEKGMFVENTYNESIGGNKPSMMGNKRPAYWMNPKMEYELGYHHLAQMFNDQLTKYFHDKDGSVFYQGLKRMLDLYKIDVSKLKYFQVNFPSKHISELIIEECETLNIPKATLYTKMSTLGYVGPPMVFICLDKIMEEEKLNHEDLILSFVTEVSKFMQSGFTLKYYK